jgi:hypothetical protein
VGASRSQNTPFKRDATFLARGARVRLELTIQLPPEMGTINSKRVIVLRTPPDRGKFARTLLLDSFRIADHPSEMCATSRVCASRDFLMAWCVFSG